jgi:hypothetical protein
MITLAGYNYYACEGSLYGPCIVEEDFAAVVLVLLIPEYGFELITFSIKALHEVCAYLRKIRAKCLDEIKGIL